MASQRVGMTRVTRKERMASARGQTSLHAAAATVTRSACLLALLLLPSAPMAQTYPNPLSNTAQVATPAEIGDPIPGNNSATDSNALALQAQLSVSKTILTATPAPATSTVQYRIVVSNIGPSTAVGVGVVDSVPAQLSNVSWVCSASGAGSACGSASDTGNAINTAVDVGVGGSVTLVVSGTAPTTTPSTIPANTVTLVLPPGTTDPTPGDNTATTTPITVQPRQLTASADVFTSPISSLSGGTTPSVLTNDTLAGAPVVAADLLVALTAAPAGYTIDAAGSISVPAGAPAGAQQVTYQICEAASPTNCSSAVANLIVAPRASEDSFNVNSGALTFTGNLALNDNAPAGSPYSLSGAAVTGLVIAPTGGNFTYTPGGGINAPLTFQYQVCLPAPNATTCSIASAHLVLDANPIIASNDTLSFISAQTGGTTTTGVLANDTFSGGPVPLGGQVTLALVSPPSGFSISLAADGAITVQGGTPAGVYTLTYRICEAAFPTNCATATARVPVAPDAIDDLFDTPGGGRALTASVANNDNITPGVEYALTAGGAPANGSVVLDANGVFTYTPNANYTGPDTFTYRVCLPAPDATACDTASVQIVVAANAVDAVDDIFATPIPSTGGSTPGLLANDTLNGQPFPPALATITLISAPTGISLGAGATLNVAPNASAGAAAFAYQLCQAGSCDTASIRLVIAPDAEPDAFTATGGVTMPGNVATNDNAPAVSVFSALTTPTRGTLVFNADGSFTYTPLAGAVGADAFDYSVCLPAPDNAVCDVGTVTINVSAAPIDAVDDPFRSVPVPPGGVTASVLVNDTLNAVPVTPAQVSFNLINGSPVGYALNAAGEVVVPAAAASGPVTLTYELCEAGTDNCDTATITLLISPEAEDDAFTTVAGRALSSSVAINDNAPAGATFSIVGGTPAGLVFTGNGSFDYTPAAGFTGAVPFTYEVCLPAPDNAVCATALATITVNAGSLAAADDDFRSVVINPVYGGTTASVLANDGHNGAVPPAPGDVLLSLIGAPAGFTINANGTISIAGGSVAGEQSFQYQMCEAVLPGNCVSAAVRVLLGPVAVGDILSTPVGQALNGDVAANDTIAPGSFFSVTSTTPPGLAFDPDGTFTYTPPAGTSGQVGFAYQVCLPVPDDAVCAFASVAITVNAGTLLAVDDDFRASVIDPLSGGVTASVLGNDSLNGTSPPLASSVLLALTSAPPGFQLDTDGAIAVPPGSAAGAVSVAYQVCEAALPGNCAAAQAQLVIAPVAVDDALSTPVGQPVAGNLGLNDNAPAGAVYSVVGATPDGLDLGADGSLIYAPPSGTSGAVTFIYQVCLPAPNSTVCTTATATVNVNAGTLLAVSDDFTATPVDPVTGGVTGSVLGNDALNGASPPLPALVQLSLIGAPAGIGIDVDGTIQVAAGSPAGRLDVTYQICEAALPGNCATATATLLVDPLAVTDSFSTLAGATLIGNVASNDNAPPGALFSVTGASPDGLLFNADGTFAYTPPDGTSGAMSFAYQVCLPPPFNALCSDSSATITVQAGAIVANDDDLRATPIDPVTGGTTASVLLNDSLNGVSPPSASSVILSLAAPPPGISVGPGGVINVAPGTTAGAMTLGYTLCEAVLPSNCATATVQLLISPAPVDDLLSTPVGQVLIGTVAGNDNVPPTAQFSLIGPPLTDLAFNADGTFTYTPPTGTSGQVSFDYRVCLPAPDTAACADATVTINVNAGTLAAVADDFSGAPIDPATGGTTASVLGNDTLSGTTPPLPATVLLALVGAPTGYAINTDGTIVVPAGAVAGSVTVTYQVCEAALSSNCDSATATLVVSPQANDDVVATPVGQAVNGNVAVNDNTPVDAVFAVSGTVPAGLQFNPDGSFTYTPPVGISGPVSFIYQVCLAAPNDAACATASVTINVNAGTLVAGDDDFGASPIDPSVGGTSASVLLNDVLDGVPSPADTLVQLSLVGAPAGVSIAADGTVSVAAGTAAGGIDLTYQICEAALPTNCDIASIRLVIAPSALDDVISTLVGQPVSGTVAVNDNVPPTATFTIPGAAPAGLAFNPNGSFTYTPPPGSSGTVIFTYQVCLATPDSGVCDTASATIDVNAGTVLASDDDFSTTPISALLGGSTASVLGNDSLNGTTPPLAADVQLSLVGAPSGVSISATGGIAVAPGTRAGALPLGYRLCEAALPTNCDTATAVVVIAPSAVDDVLSTPVGQPVTGNVATNDNVPADAVFGVTGTSPDGLVFNADGSFTYTPPAGTSGAVGFTYRACLPVPNDGVCADAAVGVNVNAGTLLAVADDFSGVPIDPGNGGNTPSVLANDSLNGTTPPLPATVQLSLVGAPTGYAIDPDGTVVVPGGAAAGAVSLTYQACEAALPTNCSTAGIALVVSPVANDDVVSTPVGQPVSGNVSLNDNVPIDAVFSTSGIEPGGLVFNTDGSFTYTPPTGTSGPVAFAYRVCLAAPNDTTCDTASVTINVNAGTLLAVDDDFSASVIDPVTGGVLPSVLLNDTLNGAMPPLPAQLQLSLVGAPAGVAINADGSVNVAAGSAAGRTTLTYQVCEAALPGNCDSADIIMVVAPQANDDAVSTQVGVTLNGNVGANDNVPPGAQFSVSGTGPAGLVLNANGSFSFAPPVGISGPVTFAYQVCLPAPDGGRCATADVTINVNAGTVLAVADDLRVPAIDPATGGVTASVLANDSLNGVTSPLPATVQLSLVTAPAGYSIHTDGTIVVAAGVPAGSTTLTYRICEATLPANCGSATATLVVSPVAVDDAVSTTAGQQVAGNVRTNDNVPADAVFSVSGATPQGLVLNGDGSFEFTPPAGASGPVEFTYQVCLPAPDDSVCATASAVINVNAGTLLAVDDDFRASLVDPQGGASLPVSVLANDTLNGTTPPPSAAVILSLVAPPAGVSIDASGIISVAPGTAAGALSITYQTCEAALPTNCDTATIRLLVSPVAVVDIVSVPSGQVLNGNVAGNDNVPPDAVFSATGPALAGLALENDGTFVYTPPVGTSGTVGFTYQVCLPAPDTTICSTASVTINVNAGTLIANDDTFATTPIDPATGGSTASVLVNDSLNGVAPPPAGALQLALVGAVPAGVGIGATGEISAVAGTAAGSYLVVYQACEVALPTNCDTADVRLLIAPLAVDDVVTGQLGQPTVGNVGDNDNVPIDAVFSVSGATPQGLTFNANGTFLYAPPVGTTGPVTFDYQACLPVPSNDVCDLAGVTINLVAGTVDAVDDDFRNAPIDPVTGGSIVTSVLANDSVAGAAPPLPASVQLSLVGAPAGVDIDGTGIISVAPGTMAGALTLTYRLCEAAAPTNCDTASIALLVLPVAVADTVSTPAGQVVTGNVSTNDNVPGGSVFTISGTTPPGLTFNTDGSFSYAPPGGTSGPVSFVYQVCLPMPDSGVCATAAVTITVGAAINVIEAFDDDFSATPINPTTGGTTTGSVLDNDRFNATTPPPPNAVIPSLSSPPAGITIQPNGTLAVAPGTASGQYTLGYRICDAAQPGNCATAQVTLRIQSPAATLVAFDDVASVLAATGGSNVVNVLENDTYGGLTLDPALVVFTPVPTPALSFGSDGALNVAAGLPAGTYTTTYAICLVSDPSVCATATVSVTLVATAGVLSANADTLPSVPGTGGSNLLNVLANDTYNGAPLDPAQVVFTPVPTAQLSFDAAGNLSVAAGVAPGTYTTSYAICLVADGSVCSTGTVSVTVVAANVVQAVDDDFGALAINPAVGGATPSVLENDRFNGAVPPGGSVVLNLVGPPPGFSLAASGAILVSAGTAPGLYPLTYRLCERAAPANCVQAVATVRVQAPAGSLAAFDDVVASVPVTGAGNVRNVLANDTLDGAALDRSAVVFTPVTTSALGFDTAGNLSVAPGLAAGVYTTTYRICLVAQPAVCATATVRVTVVAATTLQAVDDDFGNVLINPASGGATPSVFGNDLYNGVSPLPAGNVTASLVSGPPGVSLTATGAILVPAGLAPGDYQVTYRICERSVPANCSQAVARVAVRAPAGALVAFDDVVDAVPTAGGGNVRNVLGNDLSDGAVLDPSTVSFSAVATAALRFDAAGNLSVVPALAPGTYSTTYTICLRAQPTVCATATVRVTVVAERLEATDDTWMLPTNASLMLDVLANDRENGLAASADAITITITSQLPYGTASVMSGGTVWAALTTWFSGTQSFDYRICLITDPSDCATATVTLMVPANTLVLADDTAAVAADGETMIDVLANDAVRGAPLDPDSLWIAMEPTRGSVSCEGGSCIYRALRAFGGADQFRYGICDVSVPTPACAEATVTVAGSGGETTLRLTKAAATRTAQIGDLVRYVVTIDNVGDLDARGVSLLDTLPPGFVFVRGGFEVGDADNAARASGVQPLRIDGIDVAVGDTATVVYYLRVGAGTGTGVHTNRIVAVDAQGGSISNVAHADVEIVADPLLEESLVVGSVFDDRNGNGVQDAGERGIPGVRIAAVEGLLMETDAYGRYHLLGIPGGGDRGRNFILKVDPATLPSGADFTTPNPLVRRITPGVPVRFDFGVRLPAGGLAPVAGADIALAAAVFVTGEAAIPPAHAPVLDKAAEALSARGGGRVRIGVDPGGMELGGRRAEAIRTALADLLAPAVALNTRIELVAADGGTVATLPLAAQPVPAPGKAPPVGTVQPETEGE